MESTTNTLQTINLDESQRILQTTQTSNDEVSVYQGCELTEKKVVEKTGEILVAFPKIEPQMITLLRKRFKANGFNDQRMSDAIDYVVDHYTGFDKVPAIGDFINFDRKVKHYSYDELFKIHRDAYYPGAKYDPIYEDYTQVKINGFDKPRYMLKTDAKKYGFESWKK